VASDIAMANRLGILIACEMAGIDARSGVRRSAKLYCPFGEYSHPDGGKEPAFRVYPGDASHAWCFACQEYYSPVGLLAAVWDVTPEQAAAQMLERAGWKAPPPAEQYAEALAPERPDLPVIAHALQVWCEVHIPGWKFRQLDDVPALWLSKCLGLLVSVSTEDEARQWLAGCQQVMAEVMGAR
jgi:hypothetical protein